MWVGSACLAPIVKDTMSFEMGVSFPVCPLTCLVATGRPGLAVSDPPLCCVLQMGGGAVQTGANGDNGGVPARGLGTTNNKTCHTCIHRVIKIPGKLFSPAGKIPT